MAAPVIGIDLGTTNSCAAVATETGDIKLIPYRGGQFTIPSVFAVDDQGRELVGYEAQRQWQLNPKKTVYGSKRLVGASFGAELVAEMRKRVTYPIEAGDAHDVVFPIANLRLKPTQVAAKILSKVKEVATQYLGVPVHKAVVTVPAYDNDRQRQEVREAGKSAGLEVVRIINEPTAAAIAYGARSAGSEKLAVYDLGGGTFDMSVIEMRGRVFEVKATGGDTFLGGLDFDNALIQYVLSDFKAKYEVDLSPDPIAMQRLRDMSERVKVDLSSRQDATLNIPFITMSTDGKPVDLTMTVTR
ncbi:MAG: Hsp70 family protein, partial [Deltaproteobacteria bacterium]|nr:Hsp70 family protein [Deltaproteobacteria bacterium]